jgi:nitrogen PTS system EIIA component
MKLKAGQMPLWKMFVVVAVFAFPVVNLPSNAKSQESIVRFLVEELTRTGRLRPVHIEAITLHVLQREKLGSTAVGRSLAIPHVKSSFVDAASGIVGRSKQPVDWPGATDNKPVNTVCLLIAPQSQHGDPLKALEVVARKFWQEPDKN